MSPHPPLIIPTVDVRPLAGHFGSEVHFEARCATEAALSMRITAFHGESFPPPWDVITLNPPAIHQFLINICILDRRGVPERRRGEGWGRVAEDSHTYIYAN